MMLAKQKARKTKRGATKGFMNIIALSKRKKRQIQNAAP